MLKTFFSTAAAMAILTPTAFAATIDVLWTSGDDRYNGRIQELADGAGGYDPAGNGSLDWDLTFWDASTMPTPDFSAYDVLVIGTTDTGFSTGVTFDGVLNNKDEITAARGTRTFLSGQDADYHWVRRSPTADDGPRGFTINAVNWAASGTDLGIVSLTDGYNESGSTWWLDPDSFLFDELNGYTSYFQDNSVYIGEGQDGFPVNEGLTSAGLSNWRISSHAGFTEAPDGYLGINYENDASGGRIITMVTEAFADGDTGGGDDDLPPVPLPGAAWLLLGGLGGLASIRRRKGRD